MNERRLAKLTSVVQKVLGQELRQINPRAYLSVGAVEVSPDLKHATVWVSPLDWQQFNEHQLQQLVQEYRPRLQQRLAKYLQTKFTPKLVFKLDQSPQHASKIE